MVHHRRLLAGGSVAGFGINDQHPPRHTVHATRVSGTEIHARYPYAQFAAIGGEVNVVRPHNHIGHGHGPGMAHGCSTKRNCSFHLLIRQVDD